MSESENKRCECDHCQGRRKLAAAIDPEFRALMRKLDQTDVPNASQHFAELCLTISWELARADKVREPDFVEWAVKTLGEIMGVDVEIGERTRQPFNEVKH